MPALLPSLFASTPWGIGLAFFLGAVPAASSEHRDLAAAVAERFIADTVFAYKAAPVRPPAALQHLDFGATLPTTEGGVAYALGALETSASGRFTFGLSGHGAMALWIGGEKVFATAEALATTAEEIGYNMFTHAVELTVPLEAGRHAVLLKAVATGPRWEAELQALDPHNMADERVAFTSAPLGDVETPEPWLVVGPFPLHPDGPSLAAVYPPENGIAPHYAAGDEILTWQAPPRRWMTEMGDREGRAFPYHSQAEWHYANGHTVWALEQLAQTWEVPRYRDFVEQYCRFTLDAVPALEPQYEAGARRVAHFRLFRFSMLDDTSAPALPFLQLHLDGRLPEAADLVARTTQFVRAGQVRLDDDTLARPEPVALSVWADDLFMVVPYLLRAAKLTGDATLYDDAAHQCLRFAHYLFDEASGRYHHGWFSPSGERSVAHWGRANGWVAWGTVEALEHLPARHPARPEILARFQRHMAGLAQVQATSGRWHQVLDDPTSYEETSCTAMFLLAMARGLRLGWLDEATFTPVVDRAWAGLRERVRPDGVVEGICRGTSIGFDLDFYRQRATREHDPRGLGAVLSAALEMDRWAATRQH